MSDVNATFSDVVSGFAEAASLASVNSSLAALTAGAPAPPAVVVRYLMRGEDSGASLTTWVATGSPDPNGAQATPGNTNPSLVGSIVAGSGAVLVSW